MNHLAARWPVTIEDRLNVRSSGFAIKLGVYKGDSDPAPLYITVVAGKLGRSGTTASARASRTRTCINR